MSRDRWGFNPFESGGRGRGGGKSRGGTDMFTAHRSPAKSPAKSTATTGSPAKSSTKKFDMIKSSMDSVNFMQSGQTDCCVSNHTNNNKYGCDNKISSYFVSFLLHLLLSSNIIACLICACTVVLVLYIIHFGLTTLLLNSCLSLASICLMHSS